MPSYIKNLCIGTLGVENNVKLAGHAHACMMAFPELHSIADWEAMLLLLFVVQKLYTSPQ